MRLKVDGVRLKFVSGNPSQIDLAMVEDWKCPKCFKPTRKAKCLLSQIQYGFEFDDHVDYFRCKCGCTYYCNYKIWLVEIKI